MKVKNRSKRLNKRTLIIVFCLGLVLIAIGCYLKSIELRDAKNNEEEAVEEELPITFKYTADGYKEDDIYTVVFLNDVISPKIKQFDSAKEARESFTNASGSERLFCLKHKLKGDQVLESYIRFVIAEDAEKKDTNLKSGEYDIQGGTEQSYESNKQVLKEAFGEKNCSETNVNYHCSGAGLDAYAFAIGYIGVFDGSWYCDILSDGTSVCEAGQYEGTKQ